MTLQVWAAALAVFAVLIAADLVLTKGAEGMRAAAIVVVAGGAVAASLWRDRSTR